MRESVQAIARDYVHRGVGFYVTTEKHHGEGWRAYVLIAGIREPVGGELAQFELEATARAAAVDFAINAIDHMIDLDMKRSPQGRARVTDPYLAAAAELLGFDRRFS
jgi:hypothetical protein